MNYKAEIQKFLTSQYIYAGTRVTLAIVIPGIILAYFGLLKEYFLFPLATSFVGLTDQPGPFIRRRNALLFAVVCFTFAAIVASLVQGFPILIYLSIIIFGMFFTLIGVYGQRLIAVGSITLVVFSIFIDGRLLSHDIGKSILIYTAGSLWFIVIFLVVSKIQPYKLAGQMIGENYIQLAEYLQLKAKFYLPDPNYEALYDAIIARQIEIKNLQEETRELVFKTRKIVNESTTQSRILMVLFLDSIDLYEKLFTSDNNHQIIQDNFKNSRLQHEINRYLNKLAHEIMNIGISLQSGLKNKPVLNLESDEDKLYDAFFDLRNQKMSAHNLETFMAIRLLLKRISEVKEDLKIVYKVYNSDHKLAKSLSSGLDLGKFVPREQELSYKVLKSTISLKSSHFKHAIKITVALLLGYFISNIEFLKIGHSYWILITILAILRPAFSDTKHRNLLRLYGTIGGGIVAYIILITIKNDSVLLAILFSSMILCFSLLKNEYRLAVFFMTIYVFIAFNFLNPGNINMLFKDRILDTAIAGAIAIFVSYFVFPIWEHSQNKELMKKALASNINYFTTVIERLRNPEQSIQYYKLKRKDAIIDLANLSNSFQRMLNDPKNQQRKLETVHQFVNTSHLITAYTASLAQYATPNNSYPEIDFNRWEKVISYEFNITKALLDGESIESATTDQIEVSDEQLEILLEQRKKEINENEFHDIRDPNRITHLTQLSNIREILELLYDVCHEQRKVIEKHFKLQ